MKINAAFVQRAAAKMNAKAIREMSKADALEHINSNLKLGKIRSGNKAGRSLHEMAFAEMELCAALRQGGMKWKDIETELGLSDNNGMNSYNAAKRYAHCVAIRQAVLNTVALSNSLTVLAEAAKAELQPA